MVDPFFSFLQYRISIIFQMIFLLLFLQLRYKWQRSVLLVFGCFLGIGVLDYLCFMTDFYTGGLLPITLIQIVIVQMTAWILSDYRDFRAIFTGIFSSTLVLPGNIISMILFACTGHMAAALLAETAVHIILFTLITVFLRWYYLNAMEAEYKNWKWLCTIPALFYAVAYTMICWPSFIYRSKEIGLAAVFLMVLMCAVYIMGIKAFSRHYMENELERSNEFLEIYANGLQREAEVLRKSEMNLKLMQHDSRHVYHMISVYLEEGKTGQIKALLEQMDARLDVVPTRRFCENITINGIISGYEAKAKKENITFFCSATVPKQLNAINEFELATVIANLLENAIQAVDSVKNKEERKVNIRIFPVKEQLMLEITNTFTGTCRFSKSTGLPLSSKGEGHGYGMRSVKAYANKNHAVFRYSVEDGVFCVRLLTNM